MVKGGAGAPSFRSVSERPAAMSSESSHSPLREIRQKEAEARLETLLLEGLASESIPLDEEFWQHFKAKTAKIRQKCAGRTKTKSP